MTLEGNMYHRVPPKIFLSMAMTPLRYEKDGCSQEFLNVKNEPTFPFVGTLLYIVVSYYFDLKMSIFYGLLFLT